MRKRSVFHIAGPSEPIPAERPSGTEALTEPMRISAIPYDLMASCTWPSSFTNQGCRPLGRTDLRPLTSSIGICCSRESAAAFVKRIVSPDLSPYRVFAVPILRPHSVGMVIQHSPDKVVVVAGDQFCSGFPAWPIGQPLEKPRRSWGEAILSSTSQSTSGIWYVIQS